MRPRPVGPQAGGSKRGPGEVSGGFWQAVGLKRLFGGSKEIWEGCQRCWKGSGAVLGGPGAPLEGENGSTGVPISGPLMSRKVER